MDESGKGLNMGKARYGRAPRVASRTVDERKVLVVARSGEVIVVNASGAFLWDFMAQAHALEEAARALADAFSIPVERATIDTEAFFDELVAKGALIREEEDGSS